MPIQFSCGDCGAVLRTGDDTVGKQAKCPQCGRVMTVPAASQPATPIATAPPPVPPPPSREAASTAYNPYQAPTALNTSEAIELPGGEIAATRIGVFNVIGTAWRVHWSNLGTGILLAIVLILCIMPISVPLQFVTERIQQQNAGPGMIAAFAVGELALMLWTWFLMIGVVRVGLSMARGGKARLGDVFSGGPYYLRVLGLALLSTVATVLILGVVVAVALMLVQLVSPVAGVILGLVAYVMVLLTFLGFAPALPLIVDKNMGVFESLRTAWTVSRGNTLKMLVLMFLGSFIGVSGAILCGIGVLLTAPFLYFHLMPVTYLRMTGQPVVGDLPPESETLMA